MAFPSFRRISAALLFLVPGLAAAAPQPQARTFVSAKKGADTANCSRTSPCRTFQRAISLTSPGGEVVVLDSGGYGAAMITQAITLEAPDGVYAGMTVSSGDGVVINAGTNDVVILRGLTIMGSTTGANGIDVLNAGTVHVEHCTIRGFSSGNGIASVQGDFLYIYLEDSHVSECNVGVNVSPVTPPTAPVFPSWAVIRGSRFEGNVSWGVQLQGPQGSNTIYAVLSECTVGGLSGGVFGGNSVALTVDRSVFAGLGSTSTTPDVAIEGFATLFLTNSVMPNGYSGVLVAGGANACEFGNNVIANVRGTINQCPLR